MNQKNFYFKLHNKYTQHYTKKLIELLMKYQYVNIDLDHLVKL